LIGPIFAIFTKYPTTQWVENIVDSIEKGARVGYNLVWGLAVLYSLLVFLLMTFLGPLKVCSYQH